MYSAQIVLRTYMPFRPICVFLLIIKQRLILPKMKRFPFSLTPKVSDLKLQVATAYNYCSLRDSGKHPSEWGKLFNLPTYIYYTLRPVKYTDLLLQ